MRRRMIALLCAGALVAACSGDTRTGSAPGSSSPASSPAASSSSSTPSSSSGGAPGGTWTTWGGNAIRTGVTADGPDRNGLHLAWTSTGLDGDVYGEPLVIGDTVIVATTGNSVYAFDAATGQVRWQQLTLGQPVDSRTLPCGNVSPVGITSTPVADPANNRLYVVGMMQPDHHELVALDLRTGDVLFRRPVDADGADPRVHNQRAALAFANARVYIAYGGRFGDCGNYKGRVVSVTADGSGPLAQYAVRANREGGLWAPGGPVVAADGSLFVASGNSDGRGEFDDGNAVIHLSADLQAVDVFAPADWAELNGGDVDLGTTMPAVLDNNRVFQAGKAGVGYVLDASHLGGVEGELHQEQICGRVMGGLAHDGSTVFVPCTDRLRVLHVADTGYTEQWSVPISSPGPPIVANGLVWVVNVDTNDFLALDRQSGAEVFRTNIGDVTNFSAPSAGNHTVFMSGGRTLQAYTSASSDSPAP